MANLIRNRALATDEWVLLREITEPALVLANTDQQLIVPLSFWLEHKEQLRERPAKNAVWLNSHELPATLGEDMHDFELIALHFPVFSDGRAYSSARELRNSFGYKGEVRAIGDVLRDQLFYMASCGFDSFALRDDQNIDSALRAFTDFREAYQSSVERPEPLFRRRGQPSS